MKSFWKDNKDALIRSLLILFPVLAVGLATAGDSVKLFDTVTKTYTYGSYYTLMDAGSVAILPPLAGIGALYLFVVSVVYFVKKKAWALSSCKYTCTVAALCAAVPPMLRGQELVMLPNPLFPLFLLCDLMVVVHFQKQAEKAEAAAEQKKKKKNKKK